MKIQVNIFFFFNNQNFNAISIIVYNLILNILDIESKLNEESNESLMKLIKDLVTENKLDNHCNKQLLSDQKCKELAIILTKANSQIAIRKMLSILDSSNAKDQNDALKIIVQTSKPSKWLIDELLKRINKSASNDYNGHLLLAISNLVYQTKSDQMKDQLAKILIENIKNNQCNENDNLIIDSIEAIGNLGHKGIIEHLIKLADECIGSDIFQIASIHGVRKIISEKMVQNWFIKMLNDQRRSCIVKKEIVNVIKENLSQLNLMTLNQWPKVGFNEIDQLLEEKTMENVDDSDCLRNNVINYFESKKNEKSRITLKKLKQMRVKRDIDNGFWNDAHCKEWVPSDKGEKKKQDEVVIVASENSEKITDTESNLSYSKRKKCSATKTFGPKEAQAVFRAGNCYLVYKIKLIYLLSLDIINDYSGTEEKPEYKLLAKFLAFAHFLGQEVEIGKMYIYHRRDSSRAYISV